MFYKIISIEKQTICSLEYVKNYIRISHNEDDELIEEIIDAAIETAENFIKFSLRKKKLEIEINANRVSLPLLPIIEILEVKLDDKKLDKYRIAGDQLYISDKGNLKITYIAGYKDTIPAAIKHGILAHIGQIYDNRGNPIALSDRICEIYKPYRKMVI